MKVRLHKYISDCGITSRRKAESFILESRVAVNGEVVTTLGTKIDPKIDSVQIDGETIDIASVDKMYIVVNKPRGYMTTLSDPEGRKTVMDLVPMVTDRIYPVGRLDYLSEGLLLLTNDGELANIVMHPRYELNKVYEVKVFGGMTKDILRSLRKGVEVDGDFLKPKSVRAIRELPNKTWLEFRLGEGKNREIRKMCEAHNLTVDKLRRVAIGGLSVEGIAPGKARFLSKKELLKCLGINENGQKINDIEYESPKRSVNLNKGGFRAKSLATDESHVKFRKENYFQTIQLIKEKNERIRLEEIQERKNVYEKRVEKRKQKDERKVKKAQDKRRYPHAVIID